MDVKTHWETIYATKVPNEVSWYQARPDLSLEWIRRTGIASNAPIIDVGAGASTLVDNLLDARYGNLTVLDLSAGALKRTRERLGERANQVHWLETDVTRANLPFKYYALWHDRAVFHFLTDPEEQARYVSVLQSAVQSDGHVIIATFAPDGPTHCSDLEVARYDAEGLCQILGNEFILKDSVCETHKTPWHSEQRFVYCYFRRAAPEHL